MKISEILNFGWFILGILLLAINLWYGVIWCSSAYLFRAMCDTEDDETSLTSKENKDGN